tara:strand:+ start:196 stop:612 length:417 start_codon:yes stop_codon:yes gene_type:complete
MTLTSATHLYNHIKTFNLDKALHPKVEEFQFQGCDFNIHDGILGFVHPTIGWFMVATFNYDNKQDIIESIQWVLDEYGNNYTFMVLDAEAFNDEMSWLSLGEPEEIFGQLIGTCTHREPIEELRDRGIVKVISIEPRP